MIANPTRRLFLKNAAAAAGILKFGCSANLREVNKRKAMLALLDADTVPDYIPAAFFLHFDKQFHAGQPAVDKHLEYFRHTGMDFVKIQYELTFPPIPDIKKPADWKNMPFYKEDFYAPQVGVVEGLVREAKKEALVLETLYSPFMCAGQTSPLLKQHIEEDPESVKKGLEIITESLMLFVKECSRVGVDGFYASTQGGERGTFSDISLFHECVKPFDRIIMDEINRACIFNILHVCDYNDEYDDVSPFLEYPGHVVNCPPKIGSKIFTPKELAELFRRPYMGGMERKGIIATGNSIEVKNAVIEILKEAPGHFALGADCTVPSEVDWDNLKTAITTAHEYKKS